MEKFLLILRESGINRSEQSADDGHTANSDLVEWIQSLTESGNYCNGVTIAPGGQYVSGDKMSEGESFGDGNDSILRFDTIMAENMDQALSIAKTNPLVEQGLAAIEMRAILELVR